MTLAYVQPPAAPAAAAPTPDVAHHCPARGSRHCFPQELAPRANRGSGRIEATQWYRVVVGGYETITDDAGEPIDRQFIDTGFNVEIPVTYLGLGTREAIEAEAIARYPDKALVDFWTRSAPATEF